MEDLSLDNLTFLFRIIPVRIRADVAPNRWGLGYWRPPDYREDFQRERGNDTGWCRWRADGRVEQDVDPGPADSGEEVCSMFYDSECNHFLISPTDCSRTGSCNAAWDLSWRRLMFEHMNNGRMSRITFVNESLILGGRGSSSWMPQLLPQSYDNHQRGGRWTGLVGDLCILVALAAFTSDLIPGKFLSTMARHFRPPEWRPRDRWPPAASK